MAPTALQQPPELKASRNTAAGTTPTTDSDADAQISDWHPPTVGTSNNTSYDHPQDKLSATTTSAQHHQRKQWDKADPATERTYRTATEH
jgi:hypothetical protein